MFENSDREQGRVNLDEIIKDTLALVAPRAKDEHVTLHAQLATGFFIQGDATQLQQVILNLLNNAFDALDALDKPNTINILNAEENLPKIIYNEKNSTVVFAFYSCRTGTKRNAQRYHKIRK